MIVKRINFAVNIYWSSFYSKIPISNHRLPCNTWMAQNTNACHECIYIIWLSKQCVCIRCKWIKSQWSDLAKFTFLQSLPVATPLPRHFDTQGFTVVALDSSSNADRNSLSGRTCAWYCYNSFLGKTFNRGI